MAAARKKDEDDSDGAIHKMDTLPPPEGEDDAYSAATKVGPMARAAVEAMMAKAQADENSSLPPPASFTRGVTLPKPARLPALEAPPPAELAIDKVYDEVEDGDLFEPTALLATLPPATRNTPAIEHAPLPDTRPAATAAPAAPAAVASPVAPAPTPRRGPSTLTTEVAIFAVTFAVLSVVALITYLFWLR